MNWTYHAEAGAFVAVDDVAEDLACGGNGYAFAVSQFMQSALHAQIGLPKLTVGCWNRPS